MAKDETASESQEDKDNAGVTTSEADNSDNVEDISEESTDRGDQEKDDFDISEEATYRERYAASTRENQKLMEELNALKKTKESETSDKEESESEDSRKIVGQSPLQGDSESEQELLDISFGLFVKDHPDISEDPKIADAIAKQVSRFRTDEAGNRVTVRRALEDAYIFVNAQKKINEAREEGRDEGRIAAIKNKQGHIQPTSSKSTQTKDSEELSKSEKAAARALGLTEEEYLEGKKS